MTAVPTSEGSRTSASSTSQAPLEKPRPRSVAIRAASRLLPTPPGPTRLTRRAVVSFFLSSASSRRRPMKLVASAGTLPERRVGLAMSTSNLPGVCATNVAISWLHCRNSPLARGASHHGPARMVNLGLLRTRSAIPRIPARRAVSRLASMMVRVSGALLRFTDYQRVVTVDAPTVEAALDKLAGEYQPLRKVLFNREGNVRATQKIFLNGEPLEPDQLASAAGETDCVELLLAIWGG